MTDRDFQNLVLSQLKDLGEKAASMDARLENMDAKLEKVAALADSHEHFMTAHAVETKLQDEKLDDHEVRIKAGEEDALRYTRRYAMAGAVGALFMAVAAFLYNSLNVARIWGQITQKTP
jgi:negative regulator of replication initiation